jgi:hypothetical protein
LPTYVPSGAVRALLPLLILLVWVAAVNALIEHWARLRANATASELFGVSIATILSFLVFHTYWVTGLLQRVGFRGRRSAFTIAFLPFIYLLTFAVVVELSEIETLENPLEAIYSFLTLIVFLNVPTLALGLSCARANQAIERTAPSNSPPLRPVFALAILAFTALALVHLNGQIDWALAGLNGAFLFATSLLAVVAARNKQLSPRTVP